MVVVGSNSSLNWASCSSLSSRSTSERAFAGRMSCTTYKYNIISQFSPSNSKPTKRVKVWVFMHWQSLKQPRISANFEHRKYCVTELKRWLIGRQRTQNRSQTWQAVDVESEACYSNTYQIIWIILHKKTNKFWWTFCNSCGKNMIKMAFWVSQGSVATAVRCDWKNVKIFSANFVLNPAVKEFWTSVNLSN